MPFEVITFLDRYGIEYQSHGANVARDHVNVRCPWCPDDPSYHLGIRLSDGAWGCWRNAAHRGRSLPYLVSGLLQCSRSEAALIVGTVRPTDNLDDVLLRLGGVREQAQHAQVQGVVPLPREFKRLASLDASNRFFDYLVRRGFTEADARQVARHYDLRYCTHGDFRNRIILPIVQRQGLVTWVGRSIYPTAKIRYKALSTDADRCGTYTPATMSIKDCILDYPSLIETGGRILYLVEGPFDAIKLDYYAQAYDCRATCFFSTSVRESQVLFLEDLAERFERMAILFDEGAATQAYMAASRLAHLHAEVASLPQNVNDPGDLRPKQIGTMLRVALS